MQGQAGPPPDSPEATRRLSRIWLAVAGVGVLVVAVVLTSDLDEGYGQLVSTVAMLASALSLSWACRNRYRSTGGRRRRAWLLFCFAALSGGLGNLWVSLVGYTKPVIPLPLGEIGLITGLVLCTAGLLIYPANPFRGADLGRMVLDGTVLGGSALLVASYTLFPRILEQSGSFFASFTALFAPVVDLILATVGWLLFARGGRAERRVLGLASAAFALFAISDGLTAAIRAQPGQTFEFGSPIDLGWIVGYLLLTIGVSWSTAPRPATEPAPEHSAVTSTIVMFAMLVVAVFLHLGAAAAGNSSATSNALLILVLLAVSARQTLLTWDNELLRRGLEQRVVERSTQLRAVTQRTDLLVDSVGEGVYGVNEKGEVTFVNPAALAALGYGRGEILGRDAHALFHDHLAARHRVEGPTAAGGTKAIDRYAGGTSASEDVLAGSFGSDPAEPCYLMRVIADGLPVSGLEDIYRNADGRLIPVEVTASPLNPEAGSPGAVVVFRDVTQRREVDRLKNEFVSMVSHELRTPLTAIRGSLGLLAGGALGPLSAPAGRMVEIAMDSSRRLTRLIDQVLDLERIESGTLPLDIGSHDAADLIDAAVDQLAVIAESAQVTIEVTAREGAVVSDADRVVQCLLNLLGNAVKFSPAGSTVRISSRVRADRVEFKIDDQGRGIPEQMLESIFTRFEQVDSSDAREKGGTGLGLAISRSLVERLGGRIWAENRPSGGARFLFVLPRAIDRDAVEPVLPLIDDAGAGGNRHREPDRYNGNHAAADAVGRDGARSR